MPNSIKYNTSNESNALTIGNMHIGTGDIPKGPTSSTGFYNGINPPNGGYTIYIHKTTEGSSILLPTNDAELIVITNQIAGASYTTVNECFSYFAGQSGKFVLHSPINFMVTDGLVLNLSANILPSYPRSGTSWKDLSGESNNGTLTNGPTFDSNGAIVFDGSDDYIDLGSPSSLTLNGGGTITALCKWDSYNGSSWSNTIIGKGYGGWAAHHYILFKASNTNKILFSVSNGSSYLNGSGPYTRNIPLNQWFYVTATWDSTTKKIYYNGNLESSVNSTIMPISSTAPVSIGRTGTNGYYLDGGINSLNLYNRALTPTEILQNYYQAPIVTDGLVLALDAGNLVSYENGDTTTYSLTGSVDGTLTNGVDFNSANGGAWEFDGVDDYIDLGNQSLISGDFCIDLWYQLTTTKSEHYIFTTGYSNAGSILIFSGGIWLNSSATNGRMPGAPGGTINEITNITVERTDGVAKWYKNGIYQYSLSYSGAISTNTNYSIGWAVPRNKSSAYMAGDFYSVKMYNRGFTADEVSQNYNANINRFN